MNYQQHESNGIHSIDLNAITTPLSSTVVALVDDNSDFSESLAGFLRQHGFSVHLFPNGLSFLQDNDQKPGLYKVIVLDVVMPGLSGIDVANQLRAQQNPKMPYSILMLTEQANVQDCITGLNAGADDYVRKPVQYEEIAARLSALQRRYYSIPETFLQHSAYVDDVLHTFTVNVAARSIEYNGKVIFLSKRLFLLLRTLLMKKGQLVTRAELLSVLYSHTHGAAAKSLDGSNALEVHICSLRKYFWKNMIRTIRSIGYIVD
jgi:DNA-binding response OmpR family regulator